MGSLESLVDYRFQDRYYVSEFVQPKTYEIEAKAKEFNATGNEFVDKVAVFIRDEFKYPLIGGQPSADGQILRFRKSLLSYQWKKCVYYMWSFPSEVFVQKLGICIDTANLGSSLLRAGNLDAFTCLGEVRKTSTDELLGYHAWSITPYKGNTALCEFTIHESGVYNMVILHNAYHKDSEFAIKGDIYYIEHARYNEVNYVGTTELGRSGIIFALMGKPLKLLNRYGLEKTLKIHPKTLYHEWRLEELKRTAIIGEAWRR